MGKLLRVNMSGLKATFEDLPEKYKYLGGRGLTSRLILDEVPPTCHPLGPNNKLVFAPGLITGTAAPNSGRISVGGKSPLTGGIKEANAGSPASQRMARLGIRGIILEGQPSDRDRFWLLKISKDSAELLPADELKGMDMTATNRRLVDKYGEKIGIVGIGMAGEMRLMAAGVCFNDNENRGSRYAARGGLGAVMGSKGLKAIVIDDAGASKIEIKNPDLFKQGVKKLTDALTAHDVTKPGGALNAAGTAGMVNLLNEVGVLPWRNFRKGQYDDAFKISGEAMIETVNTRGGTGTMQHSCHPGCIIKCSTVYPRPDGSEHVSCLEYESVWALGANLDISNMDNIAEMTRLCNDLGLDAIEVGVAIGVAMEAGVIPFGDGEAAVRLVREIEKGTNLGRIIGNGAAVVGQVFGVSRVPVVMGQALPGYDPRASKGMGISYATNPMGADHTAGYTALSEIFGSGGKVDPLATEGKVEISRNVQVLGAYLDSFGYCVFIVFGILDIPFGSEGVLEIINGIYGINLTTDDANRIGMEVIQNELEFNRLAGISEMRDGVPEFMRLEKLPPHNHVYDVDVSTFAKVWRE